MFRICDLAEQEIPNFGGIKFTSNDSLDQILSATLALGFDSAILVSLNVFPEFGQAVNNAIQENRWKGAISAQKVLTEQFNNLATTLKAQFNQVNSNIACGYARKTSFSLNKN